MPEVRHFCQDGFVVHAQIMFLINRDRQTGAQNALLAVNQNRMVGALIHDVEQLSNLPGVFILVGLAGGGGAENGTQK